MQRLLLLPRHRALTTAAHPRAGTLLVRDVLKRKERSRWTCEASVTVFDATKKMVLENVGSLVVTRHGKVVGIITERDYLRKVVHAGKSSATTPVSDIATMGADALVVASLDDTIQDTLDAMASKDVRHLPVADAKGEVVGLLSIREVAKALAKERDNAFRMLDQIQTESKLPIHDG
jgi:CBS domain-containing protein